MTTRFAVYNHRVKLYEANSPYETRDHFTTNAAKARVYSSLADAEDVAHAINNTTGDGCWVATTTNIEQITEAEETRRGAASLNQLGKIRTQASRGLLSPAY